MDNVTNRIKSIARFIAEDYGLRVEVTPQMGPPAHVEGDKLVFSLPAMTAIAGRDGDLKAFVYREASVALHSDKKLYNTVKETAALPDISSERVTEFKKVFSVLEHRRTTKALKDSYAGVEQTVNKFDEQTLERLVSSGKTKDDNLLQAIALACNNPTLESKLPSDINVEPFRDLIDRVESARSTDAVLDLTTEFINKFKLKLSEDESDKKDKDKDGEGEGEGKDGEGEGDSSKDKDSEGSKGDKKGKDIAKGLRQRNGSTPTDKDSTSVEMPDAPPDVKIPEEVRYWVLAEAKAEDVVQKAEPRQMYTWRAYKEELNKHIILMSNKLRDVLLLEKARRFLGGYTEGHKFDVTAVSRYVSGDDRLFKKRKKENKVDVCFTLLVDMSGSMSGTKIYEATKSVIVLSEVLAKTGIPFEVIGFTTTSGSEKCYDAQHELTTRDSKTAQYTRCEPLKHTVFKSYDDPYDSIAKRKTVALKAGGNNFDGEGVLWAYSRIRLRPEKKKILVVLSDGHPAGYNNCAESQDGLLKSVCEQIESKPDVELFGIGYLSHAVKSYYKNHILIDNVSELPDKLLKLLKKVILGGK